MSEIPERLAARLERLVRQAQREKRAPSISAAVLRDGDLIWETAVGAADVEAVLEATPDTQYRIGSITKTFTAAAIMQLRDAGKLDLEDTLDRHVEGAAHTPTIRRLLSHASGLQRETQDDSWLSLRFARPDELLETLAQAELVLPSGARFHYSNLAFALLGTVVERWLSGYGLGLGLSRDGDRILAGHGGSMPGFIAVLAFSAQEKVAAAALTNESEADLSELGTALVGTTVDEWPVAPETWRVGEPPPDDVVPLLGIWFMEAARLVFRWREGKLESRFDGIPDWRPSSVYERETDDRWRTVSGPE